MTAAEREHSPRLLELFGRLGIKTTWFIPGHSIEISNHDDAL
jgi:peptidoglycan/xylan/chitin deacetylase (PgdA/CDA1 family)